MKKRIAIFGGSLFTGAKFEQGQYQTKKNKIIQKMNEKFILDNYSCSSLTTRRAKSFLEVSVEERNYSDCIIALGEADCASVSVSEFKTNLEDMIQVLKNHHIQPLLVSLPKKIQKSAKAYQEVLDELAKTADIVYIYNGEMNSNAAYQVKNESQIKRTLIDLCM